MKTSSLIAVVLIALALGAAGVALFIPATPLLQHRGNANRIQIIVADGFRGVLVLKLGRASMVNASSMDGVTTLDFRNSAVAEVTMGDEFLHRFVLTAQTDAGVPLEFIHAGSIDQACEGVCLWRGGVAGVGLESFIVGSADDRAAIREYVSMNEALNYGVVSADFVPPESPSLLELALQQRRE